MHLSLISPRKSSRFSRPLFLAALLVTTTVLAQQITISPDHKDAIYALGETVTFNVDVRGTDAASITQADYALKRSGLTIIRQGTIDLSTGSATLTTSLDQPGTILAQITATAGDQKIRALGGAAVAPEQIQPSAPRPDDFDAFWAAKIADLQKIPVNPQLTPSDSGNENVDYFKLRMDNINGLHIEAQLARPKGDGKFPAILIPQWAGVYGLPKSRVVDRAKNGWLALNVMPHDLPLDQPDDYYKHLFKTTFKDYWTFGSENRDTSYFLRMYLSAYRAAEYLSARPDWDGKTLVVYGVSQGGQQSIMLAGLYPRITACLALVPSSCDVTGPTQRRAIGYPNWADQASQKHDPRILQTGRYYDPINFATHITCRCLISMGLLDETSPPTGVFATCNQIKSPKEILPLVHSDHQGVNESQKPFFSRGEVWLDAIAKGRPVPPVN